MCVSRYVGTYTATTEIIGVHVCNIHACMYVSKCTLICVL